MAHRFFISIPIPDQVSFQLPDDVGHHAVRVLRLAAGDEVVLFDGSGGEHAAVIEATAPKVVVRLQGFDPVSRESPLHITLFQALPAGDKMDWVVQKAVELGVAAIVPVSAERCVMRLSGDRAVKRVAHWQQVAVSACEQCGRNRVPAVSSIVSLPQALAQSSEDLRLMLAPGGDLGLDALPQVERLSIFVGPEGGWSVAELAAAKSCGVEALTLGPRILRSETAGLAALAAIAACRGDFAG